MYVRGDRGFATPKLYNLLENMKYIQFTSVRIKILKIEYSSLIHRAYKKWETLPIYKKMNNTGSFLSSFFILGHRNSTYPFNLCKRYFLILFFASSI